MTIQRVRTLAFGLTLAGILGFGTTQAFARATILDPFPFCTPYWCDTYCQHYGAEYGECDYHPTSPNSDVCVCKGNSTHVGA